MASIEELLRQLLQGQGPSNAAIQLEDPEYQLDLAGLQGGLGTAEAEHLAQTTETQARYERMRRAAERELPKNITGVQESAAGRGMYYAGGRVEAEGNVQKNHADYIAQTAEAQTGDMNSLLRNITGQRNEYQQGISRAQQNAAARALERARAIQVENPTPAPAAAPLTPGGQMSPIQRAVAQTPAALTSKPAAVPKPAKTAAQLAEERRWLEYVKYNPENARRVVLASRKK